MKFSKSRFSPVAALVGLSIAALVGWALHHWAGLNLWVAFVIVIGAMMINGFVAEAEDNAPGGFNNPLPRQKGKKPPSDLK